MGVNNLGNKLGNQYDVRFRWSMIQSHSAKTGFFDQDYYLAIFFGLL
jgi:hypothetical protein